MPTPEARTLREQPEVFFTCPKCHVSPFFSTARGRFVSLWRKWLGRPYCKVICRVCAQHVGWEHPDKSDYEVVSEVR